MGIIYYVLYMVALWQIIRWCVGNDGKAETSGILQIKRSTELQDN